MNNNKSKKPEPRKSCGSISPFKLSDLNDTKGLKKSNDNLSPIKNHMKRHSISEFSMKDIVVSEQEQKIENEEKIKIPDTQEASSNQKKIEIRKDSTSDNKDNKEDSQSSSNTSANSPSQNKKNFEGSVKFNPLSPKKKNESTTSANASSSVSVKNKTKLKVKKRVTWNKDYLDIIDVVSYKEYLLTDIPSKEKDKKKNSEMKCHCNSCIVF